MSKFVWSFCIGLFFGLKAVLYAQPIASVAPRHFTIAPVYVGENAQVFIPIRNLGNQPLVITAVHGSGTPTFDWTKEPILSTGKGVIIFKWPTNIPTTTSQMVSITTNASEVPIRVKVNLIVLAKEERDTVVKGTVIDSLRQSIPYVLVVNRHEKQAVQSDAEGRFAIKARSIDTLEFHSVGYRTRIEPVKALPDFVQLQQVKPITEIYGPNSTPKKNSLPKPISNQEVEALKRRKRAMGMHQSSR